MRKYRFKKSVLVKDNQKIGALLFFIDKDEVYQFTGDAASAVLAINDYSKEAGATLEEIKSQLVEVSEIFKNNKHQDECISELIEHLTRLELLEP
jgi:multidrug resistance efflux pump